MLNTPSDFRFAELRKPRRIWTISSIYGDFARLYSIHNTIIDNLCAGDRVIYFGNYAGKLKDINRHCPIMTINQILQFRKAILSVAGVKPSDIVFLRGVQEELWQKLLQLQFAHNPSEIFEWIIANGAEQTLLGYGGSVEDGRRAIREGTLGISRWTNYLRKNIRMCKGHTEFYSSIKRAAFTQNDIAMLFVHSGIDISKPLISQGDNFWWKSQNFNNIDRPYGKFHYIIRGCDPKAGGIHINGVTMCLDSNTADMQEPPITTSLLDANGEILDIIAV